MEIKSADEILKKHIGETMSQKGILDSMKEYAKQFIELSYGHGISDGRTGASGKEVTKSILALRLNVTV